MTIAADGQTKTIGNLEAWGRRRARIVTAIEQTNGGLPGSSDRVALRAVTESTKTGETFATQRIRYRIDKLRRASADLYVPNNAKPGATSGVVCMFDLEQTEAAVQTARNLASKGYVCIVPKLVAANGRDAVVDSTWQAMRAADVLQATAGVHGERIGFVGDAMKGRLGLYVAALDQRFIATVTDTRQLNETPVSPTGQYSLAELMAAVAPRALGIGMPADSDAASALRQSVKNAGRVFALRKASDNLTATQAAVSAKDRERVYVWLQSKLRP